MPNNNIKVSEMDSAEQINPNDLLMVTQQDAEVESIYDSKKAAVKEVAKKIVNGIQFTDNLETTNKTITGAINEAAAVGKLSGGYTSTGFTSDYSSTAGVLQWEDSGSTVDGHKVYRSAEVDFGTSGGDLLCTITVEGYSDVTFYFKQTSSDTKKAYLIIDDGFYDPHSFKYDESNTWLEYTVYPSGQLCKYQISYHVEPNSGELTAGQGFVYIVPGTATTADGEIFNDYTNNVSIGTKSHAEGSYTKAYGQYSHVEGYSNIASGRKSHAEGDGNLALGESSHAEGYDNEANALSAHAEGYKTIASGTGSHAEGFSNSGYNIASGKGSHAEGMDTQATKEGAHAEGYNTLATGLRSHAEGYYTIADNEAAHAEGYYTTASGFQSHAEGGYTIASGEASHAEGGSGYGGQYNIAAGTAAHAEGGGNNVLGNCGHAEGTRNTVYNESGHAEGSGNKVYGVECHAEGAGNSVGCLGGHTEGAGNKNLTFCSHIEGTGNSNTSASISSHTEGAGNRNYGVQAHAEGSGNGLSGEESHVEGAGNKVHGAKSHGEGGGNAIYGIGGHVEGKHNTVVGHAHHAEGMRNFIGINSEPTMFAYGTTYSDNDVVCANAAYLNYSYDINDDSQELGNDVLFKCISAPGQIQSGNGVTFVTPSSWDSSTTYSAGDVVYVSDLGFFEATSSNTNKHPATNSAPWSNINSILSPFKSYTISSASTYLLDCNDVHGNCVVAKVAANTTLSAMWEPLTHTKVIHVEGFHNVASGDYQHVQGKYNAADSSKAFIIGNGTADSARSNALTVDWSGNMTLASGGDITVGTRLSTTAQTLGAAINEIVAGGGGGGSSTLAGLTDVSITTPSTDDVLKYDSASQKWVNGVGGGSGSSTLVGLTDVSVTTPSNGQALIYDYASAKWVNGYGGTGPSTLAALGDVSFTTPSDKQSLVYDYQNQIWKNAAINYNDISNTPSLAPVAISGDYTDLSNTPTIWTDVTGTLIAGQTSITLSNAAITTSSTIDYYTDTFGVNPTNVSVVSGSVTLTFEAQSTDLGVKVRVS